MLALARECPPVPEPVPVLYPQALQMRSEQATTYAVLQVFLGKPSDGLEPSPPPYHLMCPFCVRGMLFKLTTTAVHVT